MRAVERGDIVLDVMSDPGVKPAEDPNADGVALVRSSLKPSPTGLRTADGAPIEWPIPHEKLSRKLAVPSQGRLYYVRYAMKMRWSIEKIHALTNIDPFFLDQMQQLVEFEDVLCNYKSLEDVPSEVFFEAKQLGYSDAQLAMLYLGKISPDAILAVRQRRIALGIEPVYKLVDTCAAEFEAITPYYYSTYEKGASQTALGTRAGTAAGASGSQVPSAQSQVPVPDDECRITDKKKVVIIGGGPNRVGQGIEFDYCCCHAAFSAKELGFESVMINSNPETVSTDYDTSDLLFFEPLTLEDTLNVIERLNGTRLGKATGSGHVHGTIVQFGGQTPLNLAHGLLAAGVPIIGTSVDSIDLAEDRDRFDALLERLKLKRPPAGIARTLEQAVTIARDIGYPVLVRPSYVLGGRGMEICSDEKALTSYVTNALRLGGLDDAPVLIDKFLDGAIEVDVDVIADFPATGPIPDSCRALVCGVLEQIEQAGIHSGDSACTVPPASLSASITQRIETLARHIARELRVCGLMNIQLAVKDDEIYIIEVNPRASRTVPFVAKAKHVPWPAIAAKAMMGQSLAQQGASERAMHNCYAVKESVFPFSKFPGVDVVLGPEMRSTGEVMGIDRSFPVAFAKSQMAAGITLPTDPRKGAVFVSVRSQDRAAIVEPIRRLVAMGFEVYSTGGTAAHLKASAVETQVLQKIGEGVRPNVLDLMHNRQIALIINTPTRTGWQTDEGKIRSTAVRLNVPMITTTTAAMAAVRAIEAMRTGGWDVAAMQDYLETSGEPALTPVPEFKPATRAQPAARP
jgi:carbamoyl-phosphate synthase large subunit